MKFIKDKSGKTIALMFKTQDAQPLGEYKDTSIDKKKRGVDFLLISTESGIPYKPYSIRWKSDGHVEHITKRFFKKLESKYNWRTDF
jgi:hypothetical protein